MRVRPSLGDLDGPQILNHAHRVVMVVLGDFSRGGDGVRGLGRRMGGHVARRAGAHESR